jgi:Ca-activated chloride channel family protein
MESRLLPDAGGGNLATLWARSKVAALEDSRIFGMDPDLIRDEVLDLALEYGLLTPYTGLVAVDRTPARPASAALASENVPSLLPAGSAVAAGFSPTATGWLAQCLLALFSLSVASGMLLYLPPSRASACPGDRSPMTSSRS